MSQPTLSQPMIPLQSASVSTDIPDIAKNISFLLQNPTTVDDRHQVILLAQQMIQMMAALIQEVQHKVDDSDSQNKLSTSNNAVLNVTVPTIMDFAIPTQNRFSAISNTNDLEEDSLIIDENQQGTIKNVREKPPAHKKAKRSAQSTDKNVAKRSNLNASQVDHSYLLQTVNDNNNHDSDENNMDLGDEYNQEDLNDDNTGFQQPRKSQRVPPIIITDDKYTWKKLSEILKTNNIDSCKAQLKGTNTYHLKPETQEQHRLITKLFDDLNIEFHTFLLPADKNLKVVIRHLPPDTSVDEIQQYLIDSNYNVVSVQQMSRRRDGVKEMFPLFLVTLKKTDKANEIFQEQYMFDLKIQVEQYKGRRGTVAQCHRCQNFFHAQANCRHAPRCVKCGQQHLTTQCNAPEGQAPKCVHCQGDHTANWSGCPKRPKKEQRLTTPASKQAEGAKIYESRVIVNKSYASAVKNNQDFSITNQPFAENLQQMISQATTLLQELKTVMQVFQGAGFIEMINFKNSLVANTTPVNQKTQHG